MATLGEVVGSIKKHKAQWDEAAGPEVTAPKVAVKPAPKTAVPDDGDATFQAQKKAWEKRTGRKWQD